MKEIKFRAWNGSMMSYAWSENLRYLAIDFDGKVCHIWDQDLSIWWDEPILLQYTWLQDKNGKEIYDSDIVVIKSKDSFKIWWDDEKPHEIIWDGCCYSFADGKTLFHFCKEPYECEIIWNIYENSELITLTN